ncbi:MAG: fibronectin type III-like domain-contianing protein, partial [Bacillota bacterium]|nr:fibronectin type III-like domain-contianing protein [Bacillota bacterium]
LFCFGHGLSYTKFEYNDLKLSAAVKEYDIEIKLSLRVTNTGTRGGAEVVQLYIRDMQASVDRPEIELKGFNKLCLEAGESKTVEFSINRKALSFYNVKEGNWRAEEGEFEALVGSSSEDIRLRGKFALDRNINF